MSSGMTYIGLFEPRRRERNDFSRPFPSPFLFFRFFFPPLSISNHSPLTERLKLATNNNAAQFNSNYFFERPGSLLVGSFLVFDTLKLNQVQPTPTPPPPASGGEQNGRKLNSSQSFLKYNTICVV